MILEKESMGFLVDISRGETLRSVSSWIEEGATEMTEWEANKNPGH